ncbi:VWA domain-containing protein [Edaphobacter aggregans]|uniref:VWA domain-containing protein n=1 Tax=Edaphobacter aggregans TaxID=570835 RepID=UPI001FE0EB67|nr:VWA domain-containing protein [Edaphobacter aggregans]
MRVTLRDQAVSSLFVVSITTVFTLLLSPLPSDARAATAPQPPAAARQTSPTVQPLFPASQPPTQAQSSAAQHSVPTPRPVQTPDSATPSSSRPITTIKVQANEVVLIFTVTDKKGRFITGLKRESFGLLDDGRPPVAVLNFTQQTNLPLRVGIMLDTSSSIRQRFQFEQDSAIGFLRQILHRGDLAFVEGFDIQTDLAQSFTDNIALLNRGIRKLRPGGGTALFDALHKACRDQMLNLREEGAVRRILILVSDGDDNYSRYQNSDAIKMCQRAETIIYAISTNISPNKSKGDEVLRVISEATGGQALYPVRIEDVATGFRKIEEELRSQYSLIYRPAAFKNDGSFRTINLQVIDRRYKVRVHKGYFAPRPE